jgi:hypothetical protein
VRYADLEDVVRGDGSMSVHIDVDHVLGELDLCSERIRTFSRGVRMADRNGDTELVRQLLDLIQSEFEECGAGIVSRALHGGL